MDTNISQQHQRLFETCPQPSLPRHDAMQKQIFAHPTRVVLALERGAKPGIDGTNPRLPLTLERARQFEILFREKEHRLWSRFILGTIMFVESTPR